MKAFKVLVMLFAASAALAQPSTSYSASEIGSWDTQIDTAGYVESYTYMSPGPSYSVDPSYSQLRYIGWHIEGETILNIAWTAGCLPLGGDGPIDHRQSCGLAAYVVTGTNPYTALRFSQSFEINGGTPAPISVDVGNEINWGASPGSDYMNTLWMIDGANNVWNMHCTPYWSGGDVPTTVASTSPNQGPQCLYINWKQQNDWATGVTPVVVSSGGYAPGTAGYHMQCNVCVLDTNGNLYWGAHSAGLSVPCNFNALKTAPGTSILSVANGYDVIYAIDNTYAIKFASVDGLGGVLGSWADTTMWTALTATWPDPLNPPVFVDCYNSTLVYFVSAAQHLYKLTPSGLEFVYVNLPSASTNAISAVRPSSGPAYAAISVGPDAVYVSDTATPAKLFRLVHK